MNVNQTDLSTIGDYVEPGVESAPYALVPATECDSCPAQMPIDCNGDPVLEGECAACYKCCRCEICDSARRIHKLFVCTRCDCRVWLTGCFPLLCLCVTGCDCACCTEDSDWVLEMFAKIRQLTEV